MRKKKRQILLKLFMITMIVFCGCEKKDQTKETEQVQEIEKINLKTEEVVELDEIVEKVEFEFPCELEDGLKILSLSTATMPNPDAGGIMGEDIASLEIINETGVYVEFAKIIVELDEGTTFNFIVNDLPNGRTVQVFDINNSIYDDKVSCERIAIEEIKFLDGDQTMSEYVLIEVEETLVTLTNISPTDLNNLEIVCMCDFDGSYFGGTSYCYPVGQLLAGESTVIDAIDCYLGIADVVRIVENNN